MTPSEDFKKAVNHTTEIFLIGIISAIIALGCKVFLDAQMAGQEQMSTAASWARSIMLVAMIASAVFTIGGLMVVTFYAGRLMLHRVRSNQRIRECWIIVFSLVISYITLQAIFQIDWYGGLDSWPTLFIGSLVVFADCFIAGLANQLYEIGKTEKRKPKKEQLESD